MYATHYLLGLDGLWRLLATLPETLIFTVLGLPISAIMTSKELRHRFRKFRATLHMIKLASWYSESHGPHILLWPTRLCTTGHQFDEVVIH